MKWLVLTEAGWRLGVGTSFDEPPPPAPSTAPTLSADALSASEIQLTIGTVDGATSYEWDHNDGNWQNVGSNLEPVVSGLTPDTPYPFRARARNDTGPGPASNVVQESTLAADDPVPQSWPDVAVAAWATVEA